MNLKNFFFLNVIFFSIVFSQNKAWQNNDVKTIPKIGIVSGTIIDSLTLQPIPYASISIINTRNNNIISGAISKENGEFEVKEIPLGKHLVVIEYIGYENTLNLLKTLQLNYDHEGYSFDALSEFLPKNAKNTMKKYLEYIENNFV